MRDQGIPVTRNITLRDGAAPENPFGYPVFVKPARLGSSVGISKAHDDDELRAAVELAFRHDEKVLVEEFVSGIEVEVGVLGNREPFASLVGEIVVTRNEWYDYEAKYDDGEMDLVVPARITDEQTERVQELAVQAFVATECEGMARVDCFVARRRRGARQRAEHDPGLHGDERLREALRGLRDPVPGAARAADRARARASRAPRRGSRTRDARASSRRGGRRPPRGSCVWISGDVRMSSRNARSVIDQRAHGVRRGHGRRPHRVGDERDLAEEVAGAERRSRASESGLHLGAARRGGRRTRGARPPSCVSTLPAGRSISSATSRSARAPHLRAAREERHLRHRCDLRVLADHGRESRREVSGRHLVHVRARVPRREARDPDEVVAPRRRHVEREGRGPPTVCRARHGVERPVRGRARLDLGDEAGRVGDDRQRAAARRPARVEHEPDAVLQVAERRRCRIARSAQDVAGLPSVAFATSSSCSLAVALRVVRVRGDQVDRARRRRRRPRASRAARSTRRRRPRAPRRRGAGPGAARRRRRRRCGRGRAGSTGGAPRSRCAPRRAPPSAPRQPSSSATNSSIDGKRSSGSFAIARRSAASSRSGTSGRASAMLGTGSLTCFIATATKLSPA